MLVAFGDGPYASVAQTRPRVLQRSRRGAVHQFNVGARPTLGSDLATGLSHSAQDDSWAADATGRGLLSTSRSESTVADPLSAESDCRNAMTGLIYQREKPQAPAIERVMGSFR